MHYSLQNIIEHRAKLAYQEFYNDYKHAFCLSSWEQLTEEQKQHYRKKAEKDRWLHAS
jgi:hypothetical protein